MGNLWCQSALMTEVLAIREALMVSSNEGWRDLEVKSDSKTFHCHLVAAFVSRVGKEHSWDCIGT